MGYFFRVGSITKSGRRGWKQYTNTIARFSIEFPNNLNVKEYNPVWQVFTTDEGSGWVCFYKKTYQKNCQGGFLLQYAIPYIDGKGGGCDLENISIIKINSRQEKVCITNDSLGNILYLRHPKNLVEIFPTVTFSDFVTKDLTIEMLGTLKFIDVR